MDAKDVVLNDRRQGQVVAHVDAVLPHANILVLSQALIVEAVVLGDLTTLVVAPKKDDAVGVAGLQRE